MITILDFILIMVCAVSIATALIFAAKWQEAKQLIWDERSVLLSKVKQLERDKQILLEGSRKDMETIRNLEQSLRATASVAANATAGNAVLQDKLSAILCPTANHVWRDGVCVKCGRMQ